MSLYFGVIGNRDFIKLNGVYHPFWEFLDRQPDGWLTSQYYKLKDEQLPAEKRIIFDCGAWSYRLLKTPRIRKVDVTAESALDYYQSVALENDFVVAPDHMVLDGPDAQARRDWNKKTAAEFLRICPKQFVPMGVIHGNSIEERLEHADALMKMGFTALSVGGVAARAHHKKAAKEIVAALRAATKGCWLHILGLSAPDYAGYWKQIGVDSFDGSSHFREAFSNGTFYLENGDRMAKHRAARVGEPITAPECHCFACRELRKHGIDTRSFGSNQHNMGRAAHNMNQLMMTHRVAMGRIIVLVACCGDKTADPARAADLYQSQLFRKSRAWAESNGDCWYILSAKYGLLSPTEIVRPYDQTLNDMDRSATDQWSQRVAADLTKVVGGNDKIVVLAGQKYRGFTKYMPHLITVPMEGLGIGQQLSWLTP